jgi:hypothetical protein
MGKPKPNLKPRSRMEKTKEEVCIITVQEVKKMLSAQGVTSQYESK